MSRAYVQIQNLKFILLTRSIWMKTQNTKSRRFKTTQCRKPKSEKVLVRFGMKPFSLISKTQSNQLLSRYGKLVLLGKHQCFKVKLVFLRVRSVIILFKGQTFGVTRSQIQISAAFSILNQDKLIFGITKKVVVSHVKHHLLKQMKASKYA